jgi:hypothetical protein
LTFLQGETKRNEAVNVDDREEVVDDDEEDEVTPAAFNLAAAAIHSAL